MKLKSCSIFAAALFGVTLAASAQEIQNPNNGHYYSIIPVITTGGNLWMNAEQEAINQGGHLVTVRSAEENQWLVDTFGAGTGEDFFLGFNDIDEEGTFVWTSGEPVVFTNWGGGEPNDAGSGEDVTEMDSDSGIWNDIGSNAIQRSIMERIQLEFKTQPKGGFVELGSSFTLEAEAWGATGNVTYQWKKDGTDIPLATSASYSIPAATALDEGIYVVEVTDESKAIISSIPVEVIVFAPGSLPVAGVIGLGLLAGACVAGGVTYLRRRRRNA